MKKIALYTIFDKKSMRYDTPFFAHGDIHAKRHFIMLIRDNTTMVSQFRTDFELYRVGFFEVVNGDLEVGSKDLIMSGNEVTNENK
jgi:hypothetical protein